MDVADFQEYLDKYGCNDDEEGMSDEENSRLEVIKPYVCLIWGSGTLAFLHAHMGALIHAIFIQALVSFHFSKHLW